MPVTRNCPKYQLTYAVEPKDLVFTLHLPLALRLPPVCLQAAASSLLHALQKRDKLRAACMQIAVAVTDDDLSQQLLHSSAAADSVPVLQVIHQA